MKIQYLSAKRGWWTGSSTLELTDPQNYVDGVNAQPDRPRCRALDGARVYESTDTRCAICAEHHDGPDGSCLL